LQSIGTNSAEGAPINIISRRCHITKPAAYRIRETRLGKATGLGRVCDLPTEQWVFA